MQRRQLLSGLGLSVFSAPLIASAKPVQPPQHYDEQADVVIIGTGAAGSSAAARAWSVCDSA